MAVLRFHVNMENKPFETSADIDVEALIVRLHETARRASAMGGSAPGQPGQSDLETLQPLKLAAELQMAEPLADGINNVPMKRPGTAGAIEVRIKQFIKWLVHWNTREQAEFNSSVVRSLGLIAQDLQTGQGNLEKVLAKVEERLSSERLQIIQSQEETNQILSRVSRQQGQTSQKLLAIEVQTSQLNERVVREGSQLLTTLDGIGRRIDLIADQSSEAEREVYRGLKDIRQNAQSAMATVVARFQQEVNRSFLKSQQLAEQVDQIANQGNEGSAAVHQLLNEQSTRLSGLADELKMRILRVERLIRASTDEKSVSQEGQTSVSPSRVMSTKTNGQEKNRSAKDFESTSSPAQFDYFLFEHQHRGSLLDIKVRQSTYLELFRNKLNVVDLGCGRGEFVDLLTENGINVTGVDSSEDMVAFCRDRGLTVIQADIFEYVQGLRDEELDGIFLSQVVEHLAPEEILKLISLCARKLQPGGVIVAETVNTNCPTALSNFYLDPTHVRPVPPEMLRFMFEQEEFAIQTLRFSSPVPGSNAVEILDINRRYAQEGSVYQDYAIVAHRLHARPAD